MKDIDQPAFATPALEQGGNVIEDNFFGFNETGSTGLSKRQYACIHLLIPETGDEELDTLIRKAWKNRIAESAMQGILAYDVKGYKQGNPERWEENIARESFYCAEQLINRLEKQKP